MTTGEHAVIQVRGLSVCDWLATWIRTGNPDVREVVSWETQRLLSAVEKTLGTRVR